MLSKIPMAVIKIKVHFCQLSQTQEYSQDKFTF